MKSPGRLAVWVASCVFLAPGVSPAAGGDGPFDARSTALGPTAPPARPDPGRQEGAAGPGAAPPVPGAEQGLSKDDRAVFFHMPEGSELVPMAWVRALKSVRTSRLFLEVPERFGLIPDPESAAGLPIGITAATSRGAELLGPMMGINCAACHVGLVTYQKDRKPPYRLLGGPNLFDLNAFYQELFLSLGATIKDDEERLAFLQRLADQGNLDYAILTQQLVTSVGVVEKLGASGIQDAENLFQRRLLEIVRTLAAELQAKAGGNPRGPGDAALVEFQKALKDQVADHIRKDVLGLVALILSGDDPDAAIVAAARGNDLVGVSIREFLVQVTLFRARVRFLKDLVALHEGQRPNPGPGRIDAFNGIRDLVFPRSDFLAANSPVNFPALWMVNQTYWLHWDGNTNSVIERNVGQALGQGAAFEQPGGPTGTFHSTVRPEDIHTLEWTVRKLSPPEWPASIFGPIDGAKAERGKALYQKHCNGCHAVAPRDSRFVFDALLEAQRWAGRPPDHRGPRPARPVPIERLIPLDEVGTDPARAMNFATSVGRLPPQLTGGTDFALAVGQAAWDYSRQSYDDARIPAESRLRFDWPRAMVEWQTTRCYVARPLISIWASAPYLHNGSVPTVYHLLLPAKDRPRLFPVGQREYDPVRLGYAIALDAIPKEQYPLLFEINTTMSGNFNSGHEYATELSDAQRSELLEYLKTL